MTVGAWVIVGRFFLLGGSVPGGLLVQPPDKSCHPNVECVADAQKCGDGNRTASLDLLPVPSREAEANHILLAILLLRPQLADAPA